MAHARIAGGLMALALTVTLASLYGCAETARREAGETYDGPPTAIGAGQAQAFVTVDSMGKPTAIGVRMTEAALTHLPTEHPHDVPGVEYPLALPKQIAMTGVNDITVDWNPQGHIPPGVYDTPHFDFHFYLISPAERYKITLQGDDLARAQKQPSPEFMPDGYMLPEGTAEPHMGAHAVDLSAPEFNRLGFTKTFIYGFYDGRMIFLDPMVNKAFFETKPNITENVKLPKSYAVHGYYPTKYRVGYDPEKKEYLIALEGLVYR